MSESAPATSVATRVRAVAVGGPVFAIHFIGTVAAFVLAEETIHLVADDDERRAAPHAGGILCAAKVADEVVTGGDDGLVMATKARGETREIARDEKRRWIDQVAASGDAIAWSVGKSIFVRRGSETRSLNLPSSAGGLAFAPKGFRLAIAHYNGASLWFPNAAAKPEFLEWHGSHLGVTFSSDGKFLVTTMQEPALHGWRLADAKHMRMSGYSAKVRSFSWSADSRWLVTSGSEQVVLWPFQGKDGPMGKQPKMFAPTQARVVAVACHPTQEIVGVGLSDGTVLLVRIEDGAEILARRPDGQAVSALSWSSNGERFAFGTEDGGAGILTI